MCGIAGYFYDPNELHFDADRLEAMTRCLRRRGPDDVGHFRAPGIALGHTRLAILDPETGRQPMVSQDGQVVISFNGEIYNFVELREELKLLGRVFRTTSDTEVLLECYLQWGNAFHDRLNGIWALAIWDGRTQRLLLSRDRLGEKPLYFVRRKGLIVFASEPKAILAFGHCAKPDATLLHLYLSLGYTPGRKSLFSGMEKLQPGTFLEASRSDARIHTYWSIPIPSIGDLRTDRENVESEFETLFHDAMRLRLRSDVPYGAFLSGGLDSTSIVSSMIAHSTKPVRTFSIAFKNTNSDESALARLMAKRAGTIHEELALSPLDAIQSLSDVLDAFDEPFGDASACAVSSVSRLASRHVKMVLSGDGGDEVLAGYNAYQAEKLICSAPRVSKCLRKLAGPRTASSHRNGTFHNVLRHIATAAMTFPERLYTKASSVDDETLRSLLPDLPIDAISTRDYIADSLQPVSHLEGFYQLTYFNLYTSLPDDMLAKVDRMSMYHSLEVRTPFLDHRLVELMSVVHMHVKMRWLERKSVLRNTIGRHLPREIRTARKRGFSLPLNEWFRTPEMQSKVKDVAASSPLGIDALTLDRLLQEHQTSTRSHGHFLWILLILLLWYKKYA